MLQQCYHERVAPSDTDGMVPEWCPDCGVLVEDIELGSDGRPVVKAPPAVLSSATPTPPIITGGGGAAGFGGASCDTNSPPQEVDMGIPKVSMTAPAAAVVLSAPTLPISGAAPPAGAVGGGTHLVVQLPPGAVNGNPSDLTPPYVAVSGELAPMADNTNTFAPIAFVVPTATTATTATATPLNPVNDVVPNSTHPTVVAYSPPAASVINPAGGNIQQHSTHIPNATVRVPEEAGVMVHPLTTTNNTVAVGSYPTTTTKVYPVATSSNAGGEDTWRRVVVPSIFVGVILVMIILGVAGVFMPEGPETTVTVAPEGPEMTVTEDPCEAHPCTSASTLHCSSARVTGPDGYRCICRHGYTGRQCQAKCSDPWDWERSCRKN